LKICHNSNNPISFTITIGQNKYTYNDVLSNTEISIELLAQHNLNSSYWQFIYDSNIVNLGPYVIITKDATHLAKGYRVYIQSQIDPLFAQGEFIMKKTLLEIIDITFHNAVKVKPKFGVGKRILTSIELEYIYNNIFKLPQLRKNDLNEPLEIYTNLLQTLRIYDNSGYWNLGLLHFIEKELDQFIPAIGDFLIRFSMSTGSLSYTFRDDDFKCYHKVVSVISDTNILAKVLLRADNLKKLLVKKQDIYQQFPKESYLKVFEKCSKKASSVKVPNDYKDFLAK